MCPRVPRPDPAAGCAGPERQGRKWLGRSADVAQSSQSCPLHRLTAPTEPPIRVRRSPPPCWLVARAAPRDRQARTAQPTLSSHSALRLRYLCLSHRRGAGDAAGGRGRPAATWGSSQHPGAPPRAPAPHRSRTDARNPLCRRRAAGLRRLQGWGAPAFRRRCSERETSARLPRLLRHRPQSQASPCRRSRAAAARGPRWPPRAPDAALRVAVTQRRDGEPRSS